MKTEQEIREVADSIDRIDKELMKCGCIICAARANSLAQVKVAIGFVLGDEKENDFGTVLRKIADGLEKAEYDAGHSPSQN